jgi:uncharacterized Zn-finger protein
LQYLQQNVQRSPSPAPENSSSYQDSWMSDLWSLVLAALSINCSPENSQVDYTVTTSNLNDCTYNVFVLSGERPYRCQICHQAFAHSSVLKLHIRKHTGEKPFKCPIDECTKAQVAFSQLPHLKKHMLSIHRQSKPYMCACKTFFKTKQDLQQHSQNCKNSTNAIEDDESVSKKLPCVIFKWYSIFFHSSVAIC